MKKIKFLLASPLLALSVLPMVTSCSKSKINWNAASKTIHLENTDNPTIFVLKDSSKFAFKFDSSIYFNESEKDQYTINLDFKYTKKECEISKVDNTPEWIIENGKVTGFKCSLKVTTATALPQSTEYHCVATCINILKHKNSIIQSNETSGITFVFNYKPY